MPRKTGRKSPSRRQRIQNRVFSIERGAFKALSVGLFLLGFLILIYIGFASGILLVAALAGIGIFLWGAVALPVDRFQKTGEYLWNGDFGRDLHGFWNRLLPWRERRRR